MASGKGWGMRKGTKLPLSIKQEFGGGQGVSTRTYLECAASLGSDHGEGCLQCRQVASRFYFSLLFRLQWGPHPSTDLSRLQIFKQGGN
jgi:hypothetical protein